MQTVYCMHRCCTVTYCPLVLSWAITVHKFQGFEAGFGKDDMVKYIVADMNNLDWEKSNPGTAYVVTSRGKTIGTVTPDNPYPLESNIFFDGQIGPTRFTHAAYKNNGEECLQVEKRDNWARYLHQKSESTKSSYDENTLSTMHDNNESIIHHPLTANQSELQSKIMNILTEPNEKWKQLRNNYII